MFFGCQCLTCVCVPVVGGNVGISLLLLEKDMPGIKIRKMKTQFDSTHGTTFINLEDVKVPVRNLIGQEGVQL